MRQALGMTTLQLARRLGVSQPRITKMESSEKNLKISTMEKIPIKLKAMFDDVSFGTANKKGGASTGVTET